MKITTILAALAALSTIPALPAQHNHAYAGDFNNDGFLDFGNTATGDPVSDLGTRTMAFEPTGNDYADEGFLYNGAWTPTVLSGRDVGTGSNPSGPRSGDFVNLVLFAVSGPVGATFGIYESGATAVTLTMTTGMTNGASSIPLTAQNFFDGTPSNPYGHIHGRRWVATDAGDYTVTWALTNTGTVGTQNSQFAPSGLQFFTQTFSAVPEPGTIALLALASGVGLYAWRRRRQS